MVSTLTVTSVALLAVVILALTRDWWRRIWAITLTLLLLATIPATADFGWVNYGRFALLALLVVVTWKQGTTVRLREQPTAGRLTVSGLWGVTVVAGLSTIWSIEPFTTIQQAIVLALFTMLVHGLLCSRWTNTALIAGDFTITLVLLTVSFVVSLLADAAGVADSRTAIDDRLQGIYANPNTLAEFAVFAVLLSWGIARHRRKVVYLLFALPALMVLFGSESRTSILALAIAFVIVSLREWGWLVVRITVGVAVGGFLILVAAPATGWQPPATVQGSISRFEDETEASKLTNRTVAWAAALTYWSEEPVSGVGYQAGEGLFARQYESGSLQFDTTPVHNSYLQLLLELGVLGAIPALIALLGVLRAWWSGPVKGLGAGLLGVVAAGLVMQLTESSMLGTGQAYPYIFWPAAVALIALAANESGTQARAEPQLRPAQA